MEFNIGKFLERYKGLGLAEGLMKLEIVKAVKEVAATDISEKDVEFKNGDLVIHGSSYLKAELHMKKTALEKRLSSLLPKNKMGRIR